MFSHLKGFPRTPSLQSCSSMAGLLQERKHLAFQLRDTKTVVSKLENVCGVIFHLIMVIFYLVIFDVGPPAVLKAAPAS